VRHRASCVSEKLTRGSGKNDIRRCAPAQQRNGFFCPRMPTCSAVHRSEFPSDGRQKLLGMGDKLFANPWQALQLDPENYRFVLEVDARWRPATPAGSEIPALPAFRSPATRESATPLWSCHDESACTRQ